MSLHFFLFVRAAVFGLSVFTGLARSSDPADFDLKTIRFELAALKKYKVWFEGSNDLGLEFHRLASSEDPTERREYLFLRNFLKPRSNGFVDDEIKFLEDKIAAIESATIGYRLLGEAGARVDELSKRIKELKNVGSLAQTDRSNRPKNLAVWFLGESYGRPTSESLLSLPLSLALPDPQEISSPVSRGEDYLLDREQTLHSIELEINTLHEYRDSLSSLLEGSHKISDERRDVIQNEFLATQKNLLELRENLNSFESSLLPEYENYLLSPVSAHYAIEVEISAREEYLNSLTSLLARSQEISNADREIIQKEIDEIQKNIQELEETLEFFDVARQSRLLSLASGPPFDNLQSPVRGYDHNAQDASNYDPETVKALHEQSARERFDEIARLKKARAQILDSLFPGHSDLETLAEAALENITKLNREAIHRELVSIEKIENHHVVWPKRNHEVSLWQQIEILEKLNSGNQLTPFEENLLKLRFAENLPLSHQSPEFWNQALKKTQRVLLTEIQRNLSEVHSDRAALLAKYRSVSDDILKNRLGLNSFKIDEQIATLQSQQLDSSRQHRLDELMRIKQHIEARLPWAQYHYDQRVPKTEAPPPSPQRGEGKIASWIKVRSETLKKLKDCPSNLAEIVTRSL